MEFLQRGAKIDKNVYREVINHRKLSHPNIIGFKAIHLDYRYLYIVMEYGAGASSRRTLQGMLAENCSVDLLRASKPYRIMASFFRDAVSVTISTTICFLFCTSSYRM